MFEPNNIETAIVNGDLNADIEGHDSEGKPNTSLDQFFDDHAFLKDELKIALKNYGITLDELLLMNDDQILLINKVLNNNALTGQLILLSGALKDYKSKRDQLIPNDMDYINEDISQPNLHENIDVTENSPNVVAIQNTPQIHDSNDEQNFNIIVDIYRNDKYGILLLCIISLVVLMFTLIYSFTYLESKIMRETYIFIVLGIEVVCTTIYSVYIWNEHLSQALLLGLFALPLSLVLFTVAAAGSVVFGFYMVELVFDSAGITADPKEYNYKECHDISDLMETIVRKHGLRFLLIWVIMLGYTYGLTIWLRSIYLNNTELSPTMNIVYIYVIICIWFIDYIIIWIGLYGIVGWKLSKSLSWAFILMMLMLGPTLPGFIILCMGHNKKK